MKNLWLFILLFLAFTRVSAQKIHFTDSTNRWTYHHYGGYNDCESYRTYYYGPEIILSGKTYRKLYYNVLIVSPVSMYCHYTNPISTGLFGYIREDTATGIVYAYDLALWPVCESVLFNNNLHAGDTLVQNICDTSTVCLTRSVVDSVGSVIVDGHSYRVTYFGYHPLSDCPDARPRTVIEGIGSIDRLDLINYFASPFLASEDLLCFSRNGINPLFTIRGAYHIFTNPKECPNLSVNHLISDLATIQIYPNPTRDHISLSASQNISEVTITNLTGKVVLQFYPASKIGTCSIAHLPAGMYFIDVKYGDGGNLRYRTKLLKE